MTGYQHIQLEVENRIAYLTLARPEVHNAFNFDMMQELVHAVQNIEQMPGAKVVVIRAKGSAFSAGPDVAYYKQMQSFGPEQHQADSRILADLLMLVYRSSKLIIAQVEGAATGPGCALMTVADFAFVVPEATLGFPEAKNGFVPAVVVPFLIRKIGETRAKEMLLSGDLIYADEAARYQLVNRLIPAEEIAGYVTQFATRICNRNSAASMQLTKKMIADLQSFPLEEAVQFAAKMNAHARGNVDFQRGIQGVIHEQELEW
ncbi:MAG: enoyl-CoA hydratase/isomerase family protein [Bacteroidota bacterium]